MDPTEDALVRSSTSRRSHDPIALLCKIAGVADLPAYLGLHDGTTTKEALVLLERKRREMERLLAEPSRAREAELFLELYGLMRAEIGRLTTEDGAPSREAPDYYAVLGVPSGASYAEIERAWRGLQADARDREPLIAQAWRVLGDPLNRANYDRSRRERVQATPGGRTAPPLLHRGMPTDPEADGGPTSTAELPGPATRDVHLDDDGPTVVAIPILVSGSGRWRATVETDHPAVSTRPEGALLLSPGRHTIAVHVDPREVGRRRVDASITLSNPWEQHVVALRIHKGGARPRMAVEPWMLGIAGVALVLGGWWVGASTSVQRTDREPTTVGHIYQLPTVYECLRASEGPLPTHVDVRTDGLGRPTGFSLGGFANTSVDACVHEAVQRLQFEPTRDGLPALHRYAIAPPPGAP